MSYEKLKADFPCKKCDALEPCKFCENTGLDLAAIAALVETARAYKKAARVTKIAVVISGTEHTIDLGEEYVRCNDVAAAKATARGDK